MQHLNLAFIKERVKAAHSNFIDSVGAFPEKISADHQFLLKRMEARLSSILKCFTDLKIIDSATTIKDSSSDSSCFGIKLTKKSYDKSVYIWTNGINIVIKSVHYPSWSGLGLDIGESITVSGIDFENHNWVEFSDNLLHFIHKVIYARTKSIEAHIFEGAN